MFMYIHIYSYNVVKVHINFNLFSFIYSCHFIEKHALHFYNQFITNKKLQSLKFCYHPSFLEDFCLLNEGHSHVLLSQLYYLGLRHDFDLNFFKMYMPYLTIFAMLKSQYDELYKRRFVKDS